MTQLKENGGIIEDLNQEKVTVNVDSLEGVKEREHTQKCYRKMPIKIKFWNRMFLRSIIVCVGKIKLKMAIIFFLE